MDFAVRLLRLLQRLTLSLQLLLLFEQFGQLDAKGAVHGLLLMVQRFRLVAFKSVSIDQQNKKRKVYNQK